jgi:hypothetical protein
VGSEVDRIHGLSAVAEQAEIIESKLEQTDVGGSNSGFSA